ncbi:TRAP transporter substrate-binding protein DctP [Desulfovermiculus halophilus]|uniref:TRAP transporter substrate-binding protein DctP n=1 Tax=Desulfovermiculus halophilus TaxID=339722 RepID=UPI0004872A66|nr:TRAP transporter substrate-binding protein DctP [Desulfovermiculus halophilus]
MKRLLIALLLAVLVIPGSIAGAANYTGEPIKAKLASEEIDGDFMTVWAEKFADHMREWSDGKIDIEVYPYGTLGALGDINELCQMGVVDFVFSDYAWISSFVPQAQVLALNYIFPTEKVPQTLDWMMDNGEFYPLLTQSFRDKGLVPMSVMFEGWQWLTTNKKIEKLEDMKGLKIRVMSSKLLVEDYKAYGAVPTPMDYGEIYSGLQMGLIDGQVNPLFAIYSMKFYEVQDYCTQLNNEPFLGIPTANAEFFNSLPENVQQEMFNFWQGSIIEAGEWIMERNASDKEKMMQERPELEFNYLDDQAISAFQKQAQTVYPKFTKIGGTGSEKILEAVLKDIEKAKKELDIQ